MKKYLNIKLLISLCLCVGLALTHTAEAHLAINSAPTTPCNSIDSVDLAVHVGNQIDSRLALAASSTGMTLYNSMVMSTSSPWTRNSNLWSSKGTSTDFTGVSAWNNDDGYMHTDHGGTLISPRHFLAASHYSVGVGTTIGFIDADGNHIERQVTGSQNIAGTDIQVEVLDSDVPNSITYYPIMASTTLESAFQQISPQTIDVPIVVFNHYGEILVHTMYGLGSLVISHVRYNSGIRGDFSRGIISGDSGQPGFLIVDSQPILLFAHGGASTGPNYGNYISQINAAMTSLGGSYQVTQYIPTCFTLNAVNHSPVFNYEDNPDNGYLDIYEKEQPSTTTPSRIFTAYDSDGDAFVYSISGYAKIINGGSYFVDWTPFWQINSLTGQLYQLAAIDYETSGEIGEYFLGIKATDNGSPNLSGSAAAEIAIVNQNDAPTFTSNSFSFSTPENSAVGTTVGTASATDPDATQQTFYSIIGGNTDNAFSIASTTGIITVANSSPLDYETRHSIDLIVQASSTIGTAFIYDGGDINYATATVTVSITDVNETSSNSAAPSGGGGGSGASGDSPGIIYYNRPTSTVSTSTNAANAASVKTIVIDGVTYTMVPIASGAPAAITKDAGIGTRSQSVFGLQKYLNTHGFKVAVKGTGSPGNETTYFGDLTRKALTLFQKSKGIKPASGYLGPLTRAFIAAHP